MKQLLRPWPWVLLLELLSHVMLHRLRKIFIYSAPIRSGKSKEEKEIKIKFTTCIVLQERKVEKKNYHYKHKERKKLAIIPK